LQCFSQAFCENSCFLFTHADLATCWRRVQNRITHPQSQDDHSSCSEEIYKTYYANDGLASLKRLQEQQMFPNTVEIIENSGSLSEFCKELERFIVQVCKSEEILVPQL
jgi:hypothetical protein